MTQLQGKVALVTGAARGQGRSHALGLARAGASVIAVDICAPIESIPYALAQPEDLEQTARLVVEEGREILTRVADVRDLAALQETVSAGVDRFGRLDIVVANAGVIAMGPGDPQATFCAVVEVNLHGVWNTVHAALPALRAHGEGGAIVLVSSTAGYKASSINGPGGEAYAASKHAVVGLMRQFAYHLGPEGIRVNTIHPAGTATDMVLNPTMQAHLQNEIDPTRPIYNVLPVHLVEPRDITEALLYLVGESGRYVTGLTLAVDAGFQVRL